MDICFHLFWVNIDESGMVESLRCILSFFKKIHGFLEAVHTYTKRVKCRVPIYTLSPSDFPYFLTSCSAAAAAAAAKSLQLCPTLSDPIDGSPPGSRVPGIPQARTLEWVAISFSNA